MYKFLVLFLLACSIMACEEVDLAKTCQGEWAFFVNDTAYCELLINDSIVFPYHHGHLNGSSFHYEIKKDTFYLYANESETVEESPIQYLGPDSFKILAITPATLYRIKPNERTSNSLAHYHYKVDELLTRRSATELIESRIFPQIDALRKQYEEQFNERRILALNKKKD